ncbi:Peptidyl-prolyl cis-trans isomerase FKBP43 [Striga hermonthica]|uniref:peptidylprolyl isomerase n=1 Tax=Striga hermonthica TaxID=68872 RepID=A0A9N7MQI6_STRHE|nr:Peptidyl-prolyl cis-trans isomerase FKBP43 [Striga hermonthica]
MAFWGIEVKPWKPAVHSTEKARGRLRISQATLGIGGAKEKSIVQCNVGKRSPVLLCVLLPNLTESCHLDLEFEEADDVVFSVVGPRSVYLTGYYVSKSRPSNPHSDTESYGVDIEDSLTEKSSYGSEDDKYEDSFIDDDEMKFRSPSPVSSSEEMHDVKSRKGRGKRLRKKTQVVESDDEANTCESVDDDDCLLSIFKSKKDAKKNSTDAGYIDQATVEKAENLENGGVSSKISEKNVDFEDEHGKPERGKTRRKRKEHPGDEKAIEVQFEGTNLEIGDCLLPPPDSVSEDCEKSKKRKKGHQLKGTFCDEPDVKCHNKHDRPAENGNQEQKVDNNVSTNSELLDNVNQPEKKSKKKKNKKTQFQGDSGLELPSTTDDQNNTSMKIEEQTIHEMRIPKRTLSNGLIIEELANGPLDGKVAAPGKKVKIYYTAMLRENGHVIDSNVGKSAFKFRLGDEGIMEGWNLGIDGMHVGDKRRLVIPPPIGCSSGKHGAVENVPPDSWLVYDIELVGVRRH